MQKDQGGETRHKGAGMAVYELASLQPRTTIEQGIDNLAELVRKGRYRVLSISGEQPGTIYLSLKRVDLDWYLQNSDELAASLLTSGTALTVRSLASQY